MYIIGVERHFSEDNNIVVSRMLDEGGARWSPPQRVTTVRQGLRRLLCTFYVDGVFRCAQTGGTRWSPPRRVTTVRIQGLLRVS